MRTNAVKTIKNLLGNKFANTNFFTSWNQSQIILDTAFIEFQDNQEETLLKNLNTEIGTEFGWVRFTASDIGDTLILITISYLE